MGGRGGGCSGLWGMGGGVGPQLADSIWREYKA